LLNELLIMWPTRMSCVMQQFIRYVYIVNSGPRDSVVQGPPRNLMCSLNQLLFCDVLSLVSRIDLSNYPQTKVHRASTSQNLVAVPWS